MSSRARSFLSGPTHSERREVLVFQPDLSRDLSATLILCTLCLFPHRPFHTAPWSQSCCCCPHSRSRQMRCTSSSLGRSRSVATPLSSCPGLAATGTGHCRLRERESGELAWPLAQGLRRRMEGEGNRWWKEAWTHLRAGSLGCSWRSSTYPSGRSHCHHCRCCCREQKGALRPSWDTRRGVLE